MKKGITTTLFLIAASVVFAQADVEKEYERLTKNTTGIPYGTNKAAGKFYNIRGFKMYAEIYGTGKPLLIIHGNGGSIGNFVNQIPFFSKKYKVIIADSRAQGASTDLADSLSYEMMADDYAALLDQMKVDSAYVIGWSDGGINGLLLAIRHPEKVAKLAVTGANLWPDSTAVYEDVEALVLPGYTSLKNKTDKNAKEKAGWKLMRLLVEEPHIPLTDLQKIIVPTLVIGGDYDVIKPAHTLLIAQTIPQSYLWILPNSGHSTPIVYKDDFNKNIDDFFSKPFRRIEKEKRFF
ncbi:MAG TPA: alpha/beta hydrolase [Flavisolibacter sp.]|jgi:pimeloyl-ACP methyl ester carboxylesterase|nr:alpha/beta hydrolase [Flavisolibacter sp.]